MKNGTKILSLFKSRKEYLGVDIGMEQLKEILNGNGKNFHFKWQSENSFIISLKLSFGTNLVFDTNYHNTKSNIIANGGIIPLTETRTKITLETRSKYFWVYLLIMPVFVLILELVADIKFPIFFISLIFCILLLSFILHAINSEEKGLIRKFKKESS